MKRSLSLRGIGAGPGWDLSTLSVLLSCISVLPSDQPLPTQMDLISTIGESAALGAAGVILWGDAGFTASAVSKTHPAYRVCRVCRDSQRVGAFGCQPQGGQT